MLHTIKLRFFDFFLWKVNISAIGLLLTDKVIHAIIHVSERGFVLHQRLMFINKFRVLLCFSIILVFHVYRVLVKAFDLLRSLHVSGLHDHSSVFVFIVSFLLDIVGLVRIRQSNLELPAIRILELSGIFGLFGVLFDFVQTGQFVLILIFVSDSNEGGLREIGRCDFSLTRRLGLHVGLKR